MHPHLSKPRLLLKTDGVSMNNVYGGFRAYSTQRLGCTVTDTEPITRRRRGKRLIVCPFRKKK